MAQKHVSILGTVGAVAVVFGCAGQPIEEEGEDVTAVGVPVAAEGLPTSCGTIYYEQDGQLIEQEEWYSFATMNRQLDADPLLRRESGLARVDDCAQARQFTRARSALEERAEARDLSARKETAALEPKPLVDKVFNGTAGPAMGVVRWSLTSGELCTGALLSSRVMLTAAHCFPSHLLFLDYDGDGTADGGSAQMYIEYDVPSWSANPPLWCLTAPSSSAAGGCATSEFRNLTVRIHPDWTGSGDTARDVALVISYSAGKWGGDPGTSSLHWKALNVSGFGEGQWFGAFGQGANDNGGPVVRRPDGKFQEQGVGRGVLRHDFGRVDWLGSGHFFHEGYDLRMCVGDSGGPASAEHASSAIVGVAANFNSSSPGTFSNPVPACAPGGTKQRWARVSNKIDWINSVLAGYALPRCTISGSTSGIGWRRCF